MGKGDIKKSRMYMGLLMQRDDHTFIKQGTRLFMVPVTDDIEEKKGALAEQVYSWLKLLGDRYEDYNLAVREITGWLRQFCASDPARKSWVEESANVAGFKLKAEWQSQNKKGGIISVGLGQLFGKLFGGK